MIALEPDVLLLDEPTAGFTHRETEAFGEMIAQVRSYLGATIVIIDHDVPMMRGLVERLYVLDAGRVIAEGPPSVLDDNAQVAEVYLGGAVSARTPAPRRSPGRRPRRDPSACRPTRRRSPRSDVENMR